MSCSLISNNPRVSYILNFICKNIVNTRTIFRFTLVGYQGVTRLPAPLLFRYLPVPLPSSYPPLQVMAIQLLYPSAHYPRLLLPSASAVLLSHPATFHTLPAPLLFPSNSPPSPLSSKPFPIRIPVAPLPSLPARFPSVYSPTLLKSAPLYLPSSPSPLSSSPLLFIPAPFPLPPVPIFYAPL